MSDLSLKKISTNAGKDMEKIELFYMTDGNLNYATMEVSMESPIVVVVININNNNNN